MKVSFEKKIFSAFVIIGIALLFFGVMIYRNNKLINNSSYWVEHTHQVLYNSENVLSLLTDIETGTRGFILTRDSSFLDPYFKAGPVILSHVQELKKLTSDRPVQQVRIDSLYAFSIKRLELCRTILAALPADNTRYSPEIAEQLRRGKATMDKIRSKVAEIKTDEKNLLVKRQAINKQNHEQWNFRFYLLFSAIGILFVVSYLLTRYNFSVIKQDNLALFRLNNSLSYLRTQFQEVFEGISDPFFVLDKNNCFTYLNKTAKIKLSYDKGALEGKNIFDVFSRYKETNVGQNIAKVQTTRQPISFEAFDEFFEYWQDVTIYPTTEGVTVFIKDATERKAYEKELLKTSQFLKETSEVALVGGWEVDLEKGTLYWTTVTREIHETLPDFKPDMKTAINFYKEGTNRETIIKLINEAIDEGKNFDTELIIITAKGTEKWVRAKGKAIMENNHCVRLLGIFQDIDEQKKLNFLVQQSEEQFRSSFENSAVGMALISPEGKWKEVNDSICKIVGYTAAELKNLTFQDITHPDDLDNDLQLMDELIAGKRNSYHLQKRYFHKDGHTVWILLAVSMVKNEQHEIVHFISQIQDITEQKNAERNIKQERKLLRTIIDNIPVNIYLKDLNSRKTLVNKKETEYMGVEDEAEILGKNDYDLYPEDSAIISIEEDREIFKTGKAFIDRETVSFKKDGTETWFLSSKIPLRNQDNEIVGLIGLSYDITARKQTQQLLERSEQKLSTLFDLSPVGFALSEFTSGKFIESNKAFLRNLGYDEAELKQLDRLAIKPEAYWEQEKNMLQQSDGSKYFGPIETAQMRKDGSIYPVLLNGVKITDVTGEELLWTVVQDITELKEKEKQLSSLNLSIEENNRELGIKNEELEQFAYVASHDLQEPLRIITGFIGKLERKYGASLEDEAKRYMSFIVDGAMRMRQIIIDILEYSSLGKTDKSEFSKVDLNTVVNNIVKYNTAFSSGNAIIEASNLPVVKTDKTMIDQVFSNLISNGIKYQREGNKPLIKVSAKELADAWQFSIADNGIGIDPKYFDKIFLVFQRLHGKAEFSGTGIGLAIVKKIIISLKGQIWVESAPGKGTIFSFTLPK